MRFTLMPGRWYGMDMIGDEFGTGLRHYGPIRGDVICPTRTGQRVFALQCYHANSPEGVHSKRDTLHTLERGERLLLAQGTHHTSPRLLLVRDITAEWLTEHVRVELPAGSDVETWLNRQA
jgi:hypothetical protein